MKLIIECTNTNKIYEKEMKSDFRFREGDAIKLKYVGNDSVEIIHVTDVEYFIENDIIVQHIYGEELWRINI